MPFVQGNSYYKAGEYTASIATYEQDNRKLSSDCLGS